jgi:hypothetical protein
METAAKRFGQALGKDLHQVELPVEAELLNESYMAIGLWLIEWEIPHLARVVSKPQRRVLRVAFPDRRHARAFQLKFGGQPTTS